MGSSQRSPVKSRLRGRGRRWTAAALALLVIGALAATLGILLIRSPPSHVLVLSSPYIARIEIGQARCPDSHPGCPLASAWPTVTDASSDGYVVGDTLATTNGGWFAPSAHHAYPITGYRYQWQRCRSHAHCSDIPRANAPRYTLTPTDVGATIRALVTARSAAGAVAQASAPTLPIGGRVHNYGCAFGVTSAPAAAGAIPAAGVGRLTRAIPRASAQLVALSLYLAPAATGSSPQVRGVIYADAHGSPGALMGVSEPIAVRAGGTVGWYTLELAKALHLRGSRAYWIGLLAGAGPVPSAAAGLEVSSRFPACGVEAAAGAPVGAAPPAIADITTPGAWAAGDRLTVSSGVWKPGAMAYSYRWQHCDATGVDCTDIPGATANTYVLSAAELGGAVRAVIRATNQSGSTTASSALSGAGPRTVSRTPSGPAEPAGGWSVAYADAFGAPLGTAAGHDNTVLPSRFTGDCTNNRGFNSDEMEVFNCSQATVDPSGLKLTCQYAPHIASGANYSCGVVNTGGSGPPGTVIPGYRLFRFMPGRGPEWAIQIIAKFPPNTGEADPGWWLSDRKWTWELDMFEGFGATAGSGGSWCHATGGSGWVGTTDPTWIFDTPTRASIAGDQMLCRNAQPAPFDPSAGYHTYTTVVYPNATVAEYIDGHPQVWDYVPHGGAAYVHGGRLIGPPPTLPKTYGGLIISYALRDTATGNPDPHFTSGVRSLSVRSIAVYENAAAHGADALNPGLVAPGTQLSP